MKRTRERSVKPRDFIKLLLDNGFELDRTGKSSHVFYRRGNDVIMIKKSKVNNMIQQRLIKEYNLK